MDLKSMLLPEKTVTFDFPGCEGLTFDLAFLSKESNQVLLKKCQRPKIDSKTRQSVDELDEDLFLKLYVKAIIKGWDGFKKIYLKELVLVKIPEGEEEDLLLYTDDNALELMKASVVLDTWISEVISDLGKFMQPTSTQKLTE